MSSKKLLLLLFFIASTSYAARTSSNGGGGGSITGVSAGSGLSGGGVTGAVSIAIDFGSTNTWTATQTLTDFSVNESLTVQGSTYSAITSTTGVIQFGGASIQYATVDTGAAGVSFVMVDYLYVAVAACNNTDAQATVDLPTGSAPADACLTGTNSTKGVLDFDPATDEAGQIHYMLPPDWTGAIDAAFVWTSTTTSTSDIVWGMALSCSGDDETYDPSFNAGSTATDAFSGTANDVMVTSYAASIDTTGCTAGDLMNIKIYRDADAAEDTLPGDGRLIGINMRIRRTQ